MNNSEPMKGTTMESTRLPSPGRILAGVALVTMLHLTALPEAPAQPCGTRFPASGTQDGGYASGGAAKYEAVELCPGNILLNWSFLDSSVAGPMPSPGRTASWSASYGTPDVKRVPGCEDSNYIGMWGNQHPAIGEAMHQTLAAPFVQGGIYLVSFCASWAQEPSRPRPPQYAFRASNVPLTNAQDPNGVVIGVSDPVTSTGWVTVTLPYWIAPDNYSILTVSVTNSSSVNHGDSVTYSAIDRICVREAYSLSTEARQGWNMLSVPLEAEVMEKDSIFPTAISEAFAYEGMYTVQETLTPLKGYWLKYPSPDAITMEGIEITSGEIPVDTGWNMIGSLSDPIPVSSIGSEPPGLVVSQFFGYDGSYTARDTVFPFRGYWVKSTGAGNLILSSEETAGPAGAGAIRIVPTMEQPPPAPEEDAATEQTAPAEYRLEQAYPNPFNPATTIRYSLPMDSRVSLKVYDVLGRVVATLKDGIEEAGHKSASWNAGAMSSGLYFYRLDAAGLSDPGSGFMEVKKALFLK